MAQKQPSHNSTVSNFVIQSVSVLHSLQIVLGPPDLRLELATDLLFFTLKSGCIFEKRRLVSKKKNYSQNI